MSVLLATGPMPEPLTQLIACYEDLDYDCAEDKLTQALLLPLSDEERTLARRYDALLGVAWRSVHRVRRAVREIYEIDPTYMPGDVPPELAKVFAKERPEPPPKPRLLFAADYVSVLLADSENDAAWWQDGRGVNLSVGLQLLDTYQLSLDLGAVQHLPQGDRPGLVGLDHYSASFRFGMGKVWRRLSVFGGLCSGASYIEPSIDEVYLRTDVSDSNTPFWVGEFGAWFAVNFEIWRGLGVGVRTTPKFVVRTYKEQPHLSYLLPLMVGVRYGR